MSKNSGTSSTRSDDLKKALVTIRNLRRKVAKLEEQVSEPVAIIGQACRLPGGADSPEKLWDILRNGVDATCDVPKDRWDADAIYDPDPDSNGGSYVRRGGFLTEPVDEFDPAFFGISPREAEAMDPMHRMLLEMSWESLENAGIPPFSLDESLTGVFTGLSVSDYSSIQDGSGLDAIHSYRGTGTIASIAPGRISHFLGLQGPNFPIDTACSSGLVALVLAVEQLRAGTCDLALAGAVNLMLSPESTVLLCRMRALSADGRCRTFDEAASGYSRGEGGGMLVLKRLSDAQKANDPVLAIIRGVACNHDGHSSGLTVPNPAAQRKVIEAALRDGGVNPLDVDYIEAHGTATELGDPIELRALSAVLCKDRKSDRPLRIGAVKTNLGHLEAAAGITGVLKVVQSLRHRQIPPHLHLKSPTSHFDWASVPIDVPTELTHWETEGGPRLAGISAFGFSGTNAHVVIQEAPDSPAPAESSFQRTELIAISARDRNAVRDLAGRYSEQLENGDKNIVADLATTSTVGRSHHSYRAVASGVNAREMSESLNSLQKAPDNSILRCGLPGDVQIAFLFTGQGSQSPGMAKELWDSSPRFRETLNSCEEILRAHMDRELLPLLLDEGEATNLLQTRYTQPALFAFEYALYQLWCSWGVEPSYVMGHSLGEYVAATAAGIIAIEDALPLVALRGRLMQELPANGKMLAVFAAEDVVRDEIGSLKGVSIAAINGPENVVISGLSSSVEQLAAQFSAREIGVSDLQVSHAFHSQLMDPMLAEFERAVSQLTLHAPRIPIISNLTGKPMSDDEALDPARWRRHIREPVQFAEGISSLIDSGTNCFTEIGPHPTLSGLGMETAKSTDIQWLPSVRRGRNAWRQLTDSVGKLYCSGYDIDWDGWNRDHGGRVIAGPTYPFQRERHWFSDDSAGGQPAWQLTGGVSAGPLAKHPLLGVALQSPAVSGWIFQSNLSADQPNYLSDHRILGKIVTPGAVYIEAMRAAAVEGPNWENIRIRDLEFERPLVIDAKNPVCCQVIISPVDDECASAKFVSRAESGSGGEWVTHARAVIEPGSEPLSGSGTSLDDRRSSAGKSYDVSDLYAGMERRGIEYGRSFRALTECWTGPDAAIGRAQLAEKDAFNQGSFGIHPCILDAGFQLLAGIALDDDDESSTRLPASIEEIRFLQPMESKGWVHGVARPQTDADVFVADITFFGEDGQPCVEVLGYQARKVDGSMLKAALDENHADSLIYQLNWQAVDLPNWSDSMNLAGTWLILEDDGFVGRQLADSLADRGAHCIRVSLGDAWKQEGNHFTVPLSDDGTWSRLLAAVEIASETESLRGVVHLWGLNRQCREDDAASDVSTTIQGNLNPIVHLLQNNVLEPGALIRFVTHGAIGPDGAESETWAAGSSLWGLLPVLQAEHPEFNSRVLDLDPGRSPRDGQSLIQVLLGECTEDRLVLRDQQLYAPRLAWRADISKHADYRLIPDGDCYRIDIAQRGTLDALRYLPADKRQPDADEVEIRIRATGLNFRDVLNVLGMYPGDPGPPGVEVAGVVTRAGKNVTHVAVGDAVFGLGNGAFADYITTPAAGVIRVPAGMTIEEAATIPLAFLTAEWGLSNIASLAAGERVLIHAAAGGVGQAAVQLALAIGAEVHATAGNEEKRNFLRMQGVKHVYSSREASFADEVLEATSGEGVDVVLNALTGEMLQRSIELLRRGGRFIELGKAEILDVEELAAREIPLRYSSFDLGGVLVESPDVFQGLFNDVAKRFIAGELRPLRVHSYRAEQIVEAFRFMAQARHIGKIVVASRRHSMGAPVPSIREDAAYIVTGATGGIGRQLTSWLVDHGAGHIILNSRSNPTKECQDWIDQLRGRSTTINWVAGDIAEQQCANNLIREALQEGHALAGVFHAAGGLDDTRIVNLTRDRIDQVFGSKVEGAWNLHCVTRNLELDFFVLFSSVAAIMGGPGQSAYAAANAYLGALAERRQRSGLPAIAVEWGAWDGPGMAGRLSDRERSVLENQGMGFLSPEDALRSLDILLKDTIAARRIVAEFDWNKIPSGTSAAPPLLRSISTDSNTEATATTMPVEAFDVQEFVVLGQEDRLSSMQEYLQRVLQAIMGVRPEQLDGDVQLGDLGFDSLMAMELRNRVENAIGIVVPVSKLLGSSTVIGLASDLTDLISAAGPNELTSQEQDTWDEGEI